MGIETVQTIVCDGCGATIPQGNDYIIINARANSGQSVLAIACQTACASGAIKAITLVEPTPTTQGA